jgi:hypothetical protein
MKKLLLMILNSSNKPPDVEALVDEEEVPQI